MTDSLGFLDGGGEAARLIRARDWTQHPLGAPEQWSPAFKSALSLVVNSPESMILAWGEELHFFFNEAYFPLLGPRLSWAMGERFDKVWADGWAQAKPIIDDAMAGRPKRFVDLPLRLNTDRGAAETWWTFSYSRVLDADGRIAGLFVLTNETTSHVKSVNALKKSQEKLVLATRAARLGQFDYHPLSEHLEWDDRCRELFGLSPGAPVTYETAYLAGLHPDDRDRAAAAVATALEPSSDGTFDVEYRTVGIEDGVLRHIHAQGLAIFEEGRAIRLIGTVQDVTADRTAQSDLLETSERLRLANRATNDAIWDWDLRRDHVAWNDALYRAYGYTPQDVQPAGAWWIAHIHPDDLPRIDASIHAVIDGGGTDWVDEYRFRRSDGSYADIRDRGYVIRDADGKAIRMIGAMLDQSDRLAIERGLARKVEATQSERDRIWESTSDLMGTAAADGFLKSINPAWQRLLGWDEATLLSRPFFEIIDPADHQQTVAVVQQLASGERVSGFINRVVDAQHVPRTIMWDATPLGDVFYVVGRDLTEQRAIEDRLRQAQKMEAVGQLTGGIAHDFNNLLAGISGSLELMTIRLSQGRIAEVEKYMTAAQGAARRAAALTHRLLAFSRRQTLSPVPTNVNALVADMTELIQRTVGPGIKVETVGFAGLWATLVDPPQLENALLNLCINARDAMPDGGTITIETANRWIDHHASGSHELPAGQYVSLCVTDTGTGMSPEVVARAFEPFFTTKPIGSGTGLGLSMIYGFTKQSGGQVRIYSEVGQGTTVCIYLPRHHGELDEASPIPPAGAVAAPHAGKTILVVDDEPTVRMLITDVLDELGYNAIEAADSVAGLKALQSEVAIDLLITDVGLPGGMNGRQMADAARDHRPNLRVLFITGYAENAVLNSGNLEAGMQVLTKPFAVEVLGARLRELLAD